MPKSPLRCSRGATWLAGQGQTSGAGAGEHSFEVPAIYGQDGLARIPRPVAGSKPISPSMPFLTPVTV